MAKKITRLLSGFTGESVSVSENCIQREALLVYVGTFQSMDGEVDVTEEQIKRLHDNHNAKMVLLAGAESLKDCPPVQLDHSTKARDTVGRLTGMLRLGEYNGKVALFGTPIFLGAENVQPVRDGRWSHLSVGADFEAGTLEELSVTPFPAAPNASLLSKKKMAAPQLGPKQSYKGFQIAAEFDPDEAIFYPWIDGDSDWGASFDQEKQAIAFAKETVDEHLKDGGGKLSKKKLSKGDEMTDEQKAKLRKHLMDRDKLSEAEADEKVSKMSKEESDAELSKLAAPPPEDDDADTKAKKEKLTAAKGSFVKLAKDFRKGAKSATFESTKVRLSSKLTGLQAACKLTPAERKAIDVDKLAKLSKESQDAVLESYEKRQPVIIPGQFGSSAAENVSRLASSAEDKALMSELSQTMHFSKGAVKRLAAGEMPTSMDNKEDLAGEPFPTSMDTTEQLKHMKHLLETSQHGEAMKHLESMLAKCAASAPTQAPVAAPMDEKHLSALAENLQTLQNQFEDLIRLAAPALEIDGAELKDEE